MRKKKTWHAIYHLKREVVKGENGVNIQFCKEVDLDSNLRIDISIQPGRFKVFLTAKDRHENRIWQTELTDAKEVVKTFNSLADAIKAAEDVIADSTGRRYSLALSA